MSIMSTLLEDKMIKKGDIVDIVWKTSQGGERIFNALVLFIPHRLGEWWCFKADAMIHLINPDVLDSLEKATSAHSVVQKGKSAGS